MKVRIRNIFQGTKLFVILFVICLVSGGIVMASATGREYVAKVVKVVKNYTANSQFISKTPPELEQSSLTPTQIAKDYTKTKRKEKNSKSKPIPPWAKKYIDERIEKLKKGEWIDPEKFLPMVRGYHDYPGFKKNLESIIAPVINKKNKNYNYRARYILYLGLIGDKRAIPPLKKILEKEHPGIKQHIATTLYKLGEKELAFSIFRDGLENSDEIVRGTAICELREIEDERVEKLIERMLHDPDESVREAAKGSLRWIRDRKGKNK